MITPNYHVVLFWNITKKGAHQIIVETIGFKVITGILGTGAINESLFLFTECLSRISGNVGLSTGKVVLLIKL